MNFTLTKAQPGIYNVDIGGQKGSFTVLGKATASGKPDAAEWIALVAIGILVLAALAVLLAIFR